MRIRFALTLVLLLAASSRAADWFELKDFGPLTQRVAVTVENPADVDVAAALVHLPLAELTKTLPDARADQICVVDPTHEPAKRDAADREFVPFQISDENLIFSLPLKAHEKKSVHVYTAPRRLNLPGFPMGTGYDSRHAYRSFENRFATFRIESGAGSNTTGMAIDLFGKTREGIGLRLAELYQTGHDAYHKRSYWGIDILKVGSGPGLGGVYLFAGNEQSRPEFASIDVDCLYQGPVETKLRMAAPVQVGGKNYKLTRYITLVADDRSLRDEVVVEGENLEAVQIGVGVRDLPNCAWDEPAGAKGYAFQTGDANQPEYNAVGLGCVFDPSAYVKTVNLPAADNGGHVYVLKGKLVNGRLISRHRLAYIWDSDGQLPAPVDKPEQLREPFKNWFEHWASERDRPIRIEIATESQKR